MSKPMNRPADRRGDMLALLLQVINDIKKTGFTPDTVEPDFYLGGDLGIDSYEMLEIWYELEQRLGVRVDDSHKRDLYTLLDVLGLLEDRLAPAPPALAEHSPAA
jgi:acyl carrier protein